MRSRKLLSNSKCNRNTMINIKKLCIYFAIFGTFGSLVYSSGFGKCSKYPSIKKFNITKFLGKWYEVERSFYLPEVASGCTSVSFDNITTKHSELEDTEKIVLEIAIKTVNLWTNTPSVSIGTAIPETEKSSIINVQLQSRLPAALARFLPGSGKYQVLYTDYDIFAVLWSCINVGNFGNFDQIWLLGRDKDYTVEIRSKIYDALTQLGLDTNRLVLSRNNACTKLL